MSEKRAQGRPCRGDSQVGRDRIIQALQSLLRSGRYRDLSRKTLAEYTGVTPALISYYFPRKEYLLEEAIRPVLQTYIKELERIASGAGDRDEKLKYMIQLMLSLYEHDGKIIDIYYDILQYEGGRIGNEVDRMTDILTDFLAGYSEEHVSRHLSGAALQGMIWGTCKFSAMIPPLPVQPISRYSTPELRPSTQEKSEIAETIFRFLTSGLGGARPSMATTLA